MSNYTPAGVLKSNNPVRDIVDGYVVKTVAIFSKRELIIN